MTGSEPGLREIIVLLVCALASTEALLRLPLREALRGAKQLIRRILHVLSTPKISDHWKERVMLVYARRLLGFSLFLPLLFLAGMLPLMAGFWLVSGSIAAATALMLKPSVLIGLTALSLLYLRARIRG
jgi:hypothetical protein